MIVLSKKDKEFLFTKRDFSTFYLKKYYTDLAERDFYVFDIFLDYCKFIVVDITAAIGMDTITIHFSSPEELSEQLKKIPEDYYFVRDITSYRTIKNSIHLIRASKTELNDILNIYLRKLYIDNMLETL